MNEAGKPEVGQGPRHSDTITETSLDNDRHQQITYTLSDTDKELVQRIRSGDEAAFEQVFRSFYARLCLFSAEIVGSKDLADEVVQEVFLKIWERRDNWELNRSLKMYLYRAVCNQSLNQRRHDRSRRFISSQYQDFAEQTVASDSSPLEVIQHNELAEALEAAIQELPERRRLTFILHRRHGLIYSEIAELMHVSQKTVGNQLTEALKFLREKLKSFG